MKRVGLVTRINHIGVREYAEIHPQYFEDGVLQSVYAQYYTDWKLLSVEKDEVSEPVLIDLNEVVCPESNFEIVWANGLQYAIVLVQENLN